MAFAAITKTGRLHGRHFQRAAKLVDDESRQRFAVNVFGDDENRLARLSRLAEDRHQIAGARNFFS